MKTKKKKATKKRSQAAAPAAPKICGKQIDLAAGKTMTPEGGITTSITVKCQQHEGHQGPHQGTMVMPFTHPQTTGQLAIQGLWFDQAQTAQAVASQKAAAKGAH